MDMKAGGFLPMFFDPEEMEALRNPATAVREHTRDTLISCGRPLYIFGCGHAGLNLRRWLGVHRIAGGLDNDPAKQGSAIDGLAIEAPEAAAPRIRAENGLVFLTIFKDGDAEAAMKQCRDLGLEYVDYLSLNVTRAPLAWAREGADWEACRSLFADDASRATFRDAVRLRVTLDPANAPVRTEPQYFIPEIPRSRYRHFVDAGAYHGDTLRAFLDRYGDEYLSYHAFEPCLAQQDNLGRSAQGDARVHTHPVGVSDRVGMAKVANADGIITLSQTGDAQIELGRLDDLLADEPVTFIKMDIEGAEPEALRGAETILRRQRPALAVCVYHEPDHLWRIPLWLNSLDLGYKLLLRHHGRFIYETVCYAIPIDSFASASQ